MIGKNKSHALPPEMRGLVVQKSSASRAKMKRRTMSFAPAPCISCAAPEQGKSHRRSPTMRAASTHGFASAEAACFFIEHKEKKIEPYFLGQEVRFVVAADGWKRLCRRPCPQCSRRTLRAANDRFKDVTVAVSEGYAPIPCASGVDG